MIRLLSVFLLSGLTISLTFAQSRQKADTSMVVRYDTLSEGRIVLNKGWKYQQGDNPAWVSRTLDDRSWQSIDPTREARQLPQIPAQGIGWLRLHLRVGDRLRRQPLMLSIFQTCASEIYLNGRLLQRYGRVSAKPAQVKAYDASEPIGLYFDGQADQVLAIRFAPWPAWPLFRGIYTHWLPQATLLDLPRFHRNNNRQAASIRYNAIGLGICLLLTLLHLTFFRYNPAQRANLYFAFFTVSLSYFFGFLTYQFIINSIDIVTLYFVPLIIVTQTIFLWSLRALLSLFDRRPNALYYGLWLLLLINTFLFLYLDSASTWIRSVLPVLVPIVAIIEQFRLTWQAVKQQRRGARIIASAFGVTVLLIGIRILIGTLSETSAEYSGVLSLFTALAPVFGISLYLAREFALDSQLLQVKLRQVQALSAQTIAQEQEKQQLLATQNETLEQQVSERTAQLQQSLDNLKATQTQLVQKEKMASLGELTAGIAHEIQNPLNFVNNFSEVSAEMVDELAEERQKPQPDTNLETDLLTDLRGNLHKILHHGQRASNIVKGMLEHSRNSSGEMQPTDLNALADEFLRLAYHGQRAKDKDFNCELITHFDPTIGKVAVMSQEIGRVLLNLFTNAFYALRQRQQQGEPDYRPTVTVSTIQTKTAVEIRVADNGTGISDNVKSKIFQPFFTTKPTGEGTGLGLSLSYDIVTKGHGGTMTVESQKGQGTEFIIQLPTAE